MITETLIQDREALIDRCIPFLEEVKDMTASTEVERWLTETLERSLYSVSDVDARLTSVFSDN